MSNKATTGVLFLPGDPISINIGGTILCTAIGIFDNMGDQIPNIEEEDAWSVAGVQVQYGGTMNPAEGWQYVLQSICPNPSTQDWNPKNLLYSFPVLDANGHPIPGEWQPANFPTDEYWQAVSFAVRFQIAGVWTSWIPDAAGFMLAPPHPAGYDTLARVERGIADVLVVMILVRCEDSNLARSH